MNLSGEARLNAPVAQVYAALNDPAILVRTIPGCQRLEQVGTDAYQARVLAGVATIKGTFDGDVRLTDHNEPHSFTLHASGTGAPGTVSAIAHVRLSTDHDGATMLRYDAEATIGGVIAGVGQRMITGVAKKTAAEFFANVDRELSVAVPAEAGARPAAPPAPAAVAPAPVAVAPAPAREAGPVWTAPAPPVDLARQRMRDLFLGAVVGAVIALLGVLVGAIVAGW